MDESENGRRKRETLSMLSTLCSSEGRNTAKVVVFSRPANEIQKEISCVRHIDMQKENGADIEPIVEMGLEKIWESMDYGDENSSTTLDEAKPWEDFVQGL